MEEYRQEGDQEAEKTSNDENQRAKRDPVAIVRQPLLHEIPAQRRRDHERNPDICQERTDEAHQDSPVVRTEHLADRYLLRTLQDEIGRHRKQTQQRDQDRNSGEDHHDLGQTNLRFEMRTDALVDKLPLERNTRHLLEDFAHGLVCLDGITLHLDHVAPRPPT